MTSMKSETVDPVASLLAQQEAATANRKTLEGIQKRKNSLNLQRARALAATSKISEKKKNLNQIKNDPEQLKAFLKNKRNASVRNINIDSLKNRYMRSFEAVKRLEQELTQAKKLLENVSIKFYIKQNPNNTNGYNTKTLKIPGINAERRWKKIQKELAQRGLPKLPTIGYLSPRTSPVVVLPKENGQRNVLSQTRIDKSEAAVNALQEKLRMRGIRSDPLIKNRYPTQKNIATNKPKKQIAGFPFTRQPPPRSNAPPPRSRKR